MKDFKGINNPIGEEVATAFMSVQSDPQGAAIPPMERKNKMVCLRIKPSVWELVGKLAYADSRTKSSVVELAIKEYADRHSI